MPSDDRSRPTSAEYRDGWERTFGRREPVAPHFPECDFDAATPKVDGKRAFAVSHEFANTVECGMHVCLEGVQGIVTFVDLANDKVGLAPHDWSWERICTEKVQP